MLTSSGEINIRARKTSPFQKKKGIILKFKTYKDLDEFNLQRAIDYVEAR